jgi:hypothetical protein
MNLNFANGPGAAIRNCDGSIKLDLKIPPNSENVHRNFWSHEFVFEETEQEKQGFQLNTAYQCVDNVRIGTKSQTFLFEGLQQKELTILVEGSNNKVKVMNNEIEKITIHDHGKNNTFDFTQQILDNTNMNFNSTTRFLYPTTTAPICFCCTEAIATKVFQPCGHWGICTACATKMTHRCPVCRQSCHTASLFVVSS